MVAHQEKPAVWMDSFARSLQMPQKWIEQSIAKCVQLSGSGGTMSKPPTFQHLKIWSKAPSARRGCE